MLDFGGSPRRIAGFALSRMNTLTIDCSPKTFHIYGYTTNSDTWFLVYSTTLETPVGINTNMTSFHKDTDSNFTPNITREYYKIAIVITEIFPNTDRPSPRRRRAAGGPMPRRR